MKVIKCGSAMCDKQLEVEDECVGWYCKPCMDRIQKNMKAWLESDVSKNFNKEYWKEVEKTFEL